jgi:hypothetical protein
VQQGEYEHGAPPAERLARLSQSFEVAGVDQAPSHGHRASHAPAVRSPGSRRHDVVGSIGSEYGDLFANSATLTALSAGSAPRLVRKAAKLSPIMSDRC